MSIPQVCANTSGFTYMNQCIDNNDNDNGDYVQLK